MELFCPNCQKKLLLDDQYAGQMMKCPMCQGTFTAPALPSYAATASTLPTTPAGPTVPPPSAPPSAGMTGSETPTTPPPSSPPPMQPSAAPPLPAQTGEYTRGCRVFLCPTVLQWVPVGAIVLMFILTFFPWVWIGFGSIALNNQNAWQAAFGSYTVDKDLEPKFADPFAGVPADQKPGASVLTIFYVLLLTPTMLLVIAVSVMGVLRLNLPAGLQMIFTLRWAIAAGLCFLLFFFLALQWVVGFGMESAYHQVIDKRYSETPATDSARKQMAFERGRDLAQLQRGPALTTTLWLNLAAMLVGGYVFWMDLRKSAPIPKIELRW